MKLTGSKTERDIRSQLLSWRNSNLSDGSKSRLLDALRSLYPEFLSALIIEYIPEQAEDEFIVMIDLDKIVWVELDRIDTSKKGAVEALDFNEYANGKKHHLIKMAIAKELALEAMNKAKD